MVKNIKSIALYVDVSVLRAHLHRPFFILDYQRMYCEVNEQKKRNASERLEKQKKDES